MRDVQKLNDDGTPVIPYKLFFFFSAIPYLIAAIVAFKINDRVVAQHVCESTCSSLVFPRNSRRRRKADLLRQARNGCDVEESPSSPPHAIPHHSVDDAIHYHQYLLVFVV